MLLRLPVVGVLSLIWIAAIWWWLAILGVVLGIIALVAIPAAFPLLYVASWLHLAFVNSTAPTLPNYWDNYPTGPLKAVSDTVVLGFRTLLHWLLYGWDRSRTRPSTAAVNAFALTAVLIVVAAGGKGIELLQKRAADREAERAALQAMFDRPGDPAAAATPSIASVFRGKWRGRNGEHLTVTPDGRFMLRLASGQRIDGDWRLNGNTLLTRNSANGYVGRMVVEIRSADALTLWDGRRPLFISRD